jgi:polyhydroxyalkanoate synthesis regulator phasin
MSAGNYIGYFAHLVEKGQMTIEEANRQLEELHRIDMTHDEFDRQMVTYLHSGSVLTKEQTEKLFALAEKPIKIEF